MIMLKTETCTSKIERVLREADDFLTVAMIMERSLRGGRQWHLVVRDAS